MVFDSKTIVLNFLAIYAGVISSPIFLQLLSAFNAIKIFKEQKRSNDLRNEATMGWNTELVRYWSETQN